MQNDEVLRFLFVINPISGGKEKNDWEAAIREAFKDLPHITEFYLLNGKDDKRSIQLYIERCKPDRVIAVGGDGTVKMLADLLKETTMVLGIIPAGSANGMARELAIPPTPEEAIEVIVNGREKKIDVIRINEEEICIHLSDLGLNALLVKYFEQSKKRGMLGYGKAVFRVLWEKQKMKVTIKTEAEELKRKAYMVVLANARKYGTGANINPDGDISDGYFEIVLLRKINMLEIMKAILTDRSFHPRRIEVIRAKTVEVNVHRKAYFQIDGELMGKATSVHARIMPGVVRLMVPKEDTL